MLNLKVSEIIKNGKKRLDEGTLQEQGMCMYRDDNGLPCVIGAGMSDEDAGMLDEGQNQLGLGLLIADKVVKIKWDVPNINHQDLLDLQSAFDNAPRPEFEKKLNELYERVK